MPSSRILVVDDESYIRTIVSAMLEHADLETVAAADGNEALEAIQTNPEFDLVLSDIMMVGMDGMTLLERTRTLIPNTPVVMVTAVTDVDVALLAMRNGAYDYLLKPFQQDQLLATVNRALEYRKLLLQNAMYKHKLEELVTARTQMLNQAISDLERSYDITLEALGDALDLKDTETEGHSKRVTAYTIALARAMDLSPAQIRTIARGAFLHDIGKMAIPDAILLKPGKLDAEEQAIMRQHCARGYDMLRKIPFLADASEIVHSHQEHFDGSGYPRGLHGTDIPLGARIFAVADALDAITSDRPYRKAQPFSKARAEIKRCSGTQFDPRVVDILMSMPDRLWADLRGEIVGETQRFLPSLFSLDLFKRKGSIGKGRLQERDLLEQLKALPQWKLQDGKIVRDVQFGDFLEAVQFVQSISSAAEAQNHHPDIDIRYDRIRLSLVTHDSGGITSRDIKLAHSIDQIV
jgi:putative nucleotidyltransferase with HDIG domain